MSVIENTPILRDESIRYASLRSYNHVEGIPDELKTSPVRRTFCLVVLFDFILYFLIWILYMQLEGCAGSMLNKMRCEVKNFHFQDSIFDLVGLATARFVYLEIMYAGIKCKQPWWLAIFTTITTAYVIIKLILYGSTDSKKHLTSYATIMIALVLSWVETLFFIYRVKPKEIAAERALEYENYIREQATISITSSQQNLCGSSSMFPENTSVLSPAMSEESIDLFYSPSQTRPPSPTQVRKKEIIHTANELREKAWEIACTRDGWTYAAGDAVQGFVTYKNIPGFTNRVYKIECLLNVSAEILYKNMIFNVEDSSRWNPQVREVTKLENVSDNVDFIHNITNEALKGYISPRDFVLIRVWGRMENDFVICMASHDHPDCPPNPNIVRGHYEIGIVKLHASVKEPEHTKCVWIISSDLKGNLMKRLVDMKLPGVLLQLAEHLRQYCYELNIPN